jgi:2-C-methyl-D-erythritol 4-phosphate cytidylyltransferase
MSGAGPAGVDALVLAAGRGERLGLGPKALLTLGGRTLVERAIDVMSAVAGRVIVGVPQECVEPIGRAHASRALIVPGGTSRLDTMRRLLERSTATLVVQHDVVHPFVTPGLARSVVAAAAEHGAAMAMARATDHVFEGGSRLTRRLGGRGAVWLARKPMACSRTALARALAWRGDATEDTGTVELLLATGQPVHVVPAEPWNIKITTAADWALAQLIAPLLAEALDPPGRSGRRG